MGEMSAEEMGLRAALGMNTGTRAGAGGMRRAVAWEVWEKQCWT